MTKTTQFYFNIATGILDKNQTIRSLAKTFNMSKSTLHKILHSEDFIRFMGSRYYQKLCDKLKLNFYNKHINGGKATALRWKTIKNKGVNEVN